MPRIILIGGTSHAGKSTLARQLAQKLGVEAISTDSLARHPGRPWPFPERPVPPHVVEHYSTLTTQELLDSVLAHYRRMTPVIVEVIASHAETGLVLEGSALLPETVAAIRETANLQALWLTAGDAFLKDRIYRESEHAEADRRAQQLIQNFAARTIAYNRWMLTEIDRLKLPILNVGEAARADDVLTRAMNALRIA